jgi:hypothetical protein
MATTPPFGRTFRISKVNSSGLRLRTRSLQRSLILQNFFLSLGQGFKSHPQYLELSAKDLVSLTTLTFDIL